ncbi:hypothetical protein [Comamonas endophytica]|uniref:Uncharacterized protein n=1 Tax=Comamonas endophytica TaxID=2949090 RepID=A0ABY6G9M9_9BURK|nr:MULTISPECIES: hypothetical protein [unclassified Acidovorax]MCD2511942.1 hypothetical protein [Acidovorax sp. D4N7]UYG51659.1 hypothetical protein M9799_16665 [Acidovorax sp. 5MLIR]UYG51729.1 hypothetical protein M9799_00250 [Acidovorax sp. 5MLIR]
MATPNYGYEKRQRELAKKQKKQDKERAKEQRRSEVAEHPGAGQAAPDADPAPDADMPVTDVPVTDVLPPSAGR